MARGAPEWEAELERCRQLMSRLLARPGLGSRSIGTPEWDADLWRLGREWLAASPLDWSAPRRSAQHVRDVYVATQVYQDGGHTALIGDFVQALDPASGSGVAGANSQLILTGLLGQVPFPLPPTIQPRVGLPQEHVSLLPGPTLVERVGQLFEQLHTLRPDRLFFFQHPHDPIVSACAQPEVAATRVLVHHSDGYPTFGLHLPGVRIVDLNPSASALTRLLGLASSLLPLAAPDPGPRPHGFLRDKALTTASCGSAAKFFRTYAPAYPETIAAVLRETRGRHVHIGPLSDDQLSRIHLALSQAHVGNGAFEHVAYVPSLADALWDHHCDVYLASFPIDGARARVEVLASGTPYLRHGHLDIPQNQDRGDLAWHRVEDLLARLRALSNVSALHRASEAVRSEYERTHHPAVFASALARIVAGTALVDDGNDTRRLRALESMARTLTAALMPSDGPTALEPDARIELMQSDIDRLSRECDNRAAQIAALQHERARLLTGTTWRHVLRRWLLRD